MVRAEQRQLEEVVNDEKEALMLRSIIVLVIFMTAFSTLVGFTKEGSKVVVKKEDDGKEITVKKGDVIQIEMEASGTAGFSWEFENFDNKHLTLLEEKTKGSTKEGFTGAPIIKIWQLRAKKDGETEVIMRYFRAWEGAEKAISKFRIKIKILN